MFEILLTLHFCCHQSCNLLSYFMTKEKSSRNKLKKQFYVLHVSVAGSRYELPAFKFIVSTSLKLLQASEKH